MKRYVGGEGLLNANIAFVGEAPGAKENQLGRPFVGESGMLFDKILHQTGLIRAQCYITNVIKHQPDKKDASGIIEFKKGSAITSDSYDDYVDELKSELKHLTDCNVIVAVGNIALYTLTGKMGITKYRGSVLESTLIPGKKVIPIIHPTAALRQYLFRYLIAFDMVRIKDQSAFPEMPDLRVDMQIEPTYNECIEFLKTCKSKELVAFDIEVANDEVSCISWAYLDSSDNRVKVISIPFHQGNIQYFLIPQERELWKLQASILEDEHIEKVAQNTTFDTTFLFQKYGIKPESLHDTMIMQAIALPDFKKGLDMITSLYTLMPYYKDDGKHKGKGVTDKENWVYNAKDSAVLIQALPGLKKNLSKTFNEKTYERQRQLIQPLLFMTERGIRMDWEGMVEKSKEVNEQIAEVEEKLTELCEHPLNPNSPKQMKDYFYIEKGIKPYIKDGRPTLDEKALKRLSRRGFKEASLCLEYRRLAKLKGTYLDINLDEDKRLRCSMNPVGTRTGRLSSSKTIRDTGMNMQNQPFIMKKFQLPDEGYIAYEIDLSQAENRIVAYIGQEEKMIEAFETGKDVHSRTASSIFGVSEEKIKEMDKDDVKCELGTGEYTHRFYGKKSNHSLNYGLGYKAFALQLEIEEREAKMLHNGYHKTYPGVQRYWRIVKEMLSKDRTVINLFGRRYRFFDRWGDQLFQDAYAFIPQSTVADIINEMGIQYVYFNQEKFGPVELLNQVHDSIYIQMPVSIGLDEHARILSQIVDSLEQPLSFRGKEFVIPAEVKALPRNFLDATEVDLKKSINEVQDELKRIYYEEAL